MVSSSPRSIFQQHFVRGLGDAPEHLVRYSAAFPEIPGCRRRRTSRRVWSAAPDLGLHLDQVDDALEVTLGADRQLDRNALARAVFHRPHEK